MLALGLNMPALLRGAGSSTSIPSFSRDFVTVKTLNHGIGPDITFTRTGTATYFNSSGVLTTATANEPRFDHDPSTLASKGLLIEEGRTNSIVNSQGTGASAGTPGTQPTGWGLTTSITGLTRTISTGTINGFNYIDVAFSGTTTGSISSLTFDPQPTTAGYTASSGQTWTGSVYAAVTSGSLPSYSAIRVSERNSSNTGLANTDVQLTGISSSLQRFNVTRTLNNSSTAKVTFDIRIESIPTSTAVDFTLRIAAPQLEQGAFATSYIPTTSAAVARGQDRAIVTPISSFFNESEMSILTESSVFTLGSTSAFPRVVDFNNNTNDNETVRVRYVQTGTIGVAVVNGGSSQVGLGASASINTIYKLSAGIKLNDCAGFLGGSQFGSDTAATMATGLTHLAIGSDRVGTALHTLNGHIRKVAYYPKRLTNDRLKSLTA